MVDKCEEGSRLQLKVKPIHHQKKMKSLTFEASLVKRERIIQTAAVVTSRSADVVILDNEVDVMENQNKRSRFHQRSGNK